MKLNIFKIACVFLLSSKTKIFKAYFQAFLTQIDLAYKRVNNAQAITLINKLTKRNLY